MAFGFIASTDSAKRLRVANIHLNLGPLSMYLNLKLRVREVGDRRVLTRFALLPRVIDGNKVWMKTYRKQQIFTRSIQFSKDPTKPHKVRKFWKTEFESAGPTYSEDTDLLLELEQIEE